MNAFGDWREGSVVKSSCSLLKNASSNPSTHVRQFKTASSYSFRGSQYLPLSSVDSSIRMYMNEINNLKNMNALEFKENIHYTSSLGFI